jgi:hypothetical protein
MTASAPALPLATQRCHHHPDREAVARCPECRRFFCRECVTEHDDRVICADCLKKISVQARVSHGRFAAAGRLLACIAGILLAWFFFYSMGRLLLLTPTSFHEGTLWQKTVEDL